MKWGYKPCLVVELEVVPSWNAAMGRRTSCSAKEDIPNHDYHSGRMKVSQCNRLLALLVGSKVVCYLEGDLSFKEDKG